MEGFLIFSISILTLAFVYVILCLALNIECGVAGMWDLGIVSYFGVGAYSYAIIVAPEAASYQHYLFGLDQILFMEYFSHCSRWSKCLFDWSSFLKIKAGIFFNNNDCIFRGA